MRILVADQDADHRASLVGYITSFGHSPEESLSLRDIIDRCRAKCPELIFLDFQLSGSSGIDIARQIRQLGGHAVWIPIILMAKTWTEEDIRRAIDAGVDDCLIKPLSEIQVLAKVRSAERHQNLKEEVYSLAHNLVVANRALESVVTQDVLTGVGNSNSFDDALERDWFEAKRTNKPLVLMMTNLDYFQSFNQTYGPAKGDEVIKQVANLFRQYLSARDESYSVARIMGETFAILLPHTSKEDGLKISEELRAGIEALNIPHVNSGCSDHITASFGISLAEPEHYTSPWDLKEASDYALYQAKHYGRNRSFFVPAVEEKVS